MPIRFALSAVRFTELEVPSLSNKLQSLGVKLGARDLSPSQPRHEAYAVEQVVPGSFQTTPYGEIYVVESWFLPDYRHGRVGLQLTA